MTVSAGILLIRNTSTVPEILLLKSAEGCTWGPPKGHLEGSEDGVEAALRETFEETGLTYDKIDLVDGFQELISYQSRSRRFKTVVFFLGNVNDSSAQVNISSEHSDFAWKSLTEALQMVEMDIVRQLLCHAFSYFKKLPMKAITCC